MKALFIIDMLNDFMPKGRLAVQNARSIIKRINRIATKFRKDKMPVFYINDAHEKNDPEFEKWSQHAVKGTKGAAVVAMLKPKEQDIVIEKKHYSGFSNAKIEKKLKELGVKEIFIAGVATEFCVAANAKDALERGDKVTIIKNAIKGVEKEKSKNVLRELKKTGAKIKWMR